MPKPTADKKIETNPYSFWAARFWHGMRASTWYRLIFRNGLRISPTRWPMAFAISLVSFFNSAARPFQEWWFRRLISITQIKEGPIFIIGHWRSGTTLLHE